MLNEEYEYYCPRCGNLCFLRNEHTDNKCVVCGNELLQTPHEYNLVWSEWGVIDKDVWDDREQHLYDEVIYKSPIFDIDLYNRKDEILKEGYQQYLRNQAQGQAILEGTDKGNRYGVRCPYCNATNVRKISSLSKAASLSFFGIFSMGKVNKQWHCTHCGSDF